MPDLLLIPRERTDPLTDAETIRIGRWIARSTECATSFPHDRVAVCVIDRSEPLPEALIDKVTTVLGPVDQSVVPSQCTTARSAMDEPQKRARVGVRRLVQLVPKKPWWWWVYMTVFVAFWVACMITVVMTLYSDPRDPNYRDKWHPGNVGD